MLFNKKIIFKNLLLLSFLIFPLVTLAQTASLLIKISPEYPGPQEVVTALVSSSSFNLDLANITWTLGGKKISSNVGQKSVSFKVGEVGEPLSVKAVATLGNTSSSGTILINPSEINILWQATDVYVPPFYKGKALPTSEASIKITAVPNIWRNNGGTYKTSDLSYKWRRDSEVLGSLSGRGVSTLFLKNDYLKKTEQIGVEVRNTSDFKVGKEEVVIQIVEPKVLFYEKNPILGILYGKALSGSLPLSNEELSIAAEPYFFSPNNKTSSKIKYNWSLNNGPVKSDGLNPDVLVVRQQSGTSGSANVSIEITNPSKIMLSARNNIMLNFKGR